MLVPQAEVNYATIGGVPGSPRSTLYMMPRTDGIVLGSTSERGIWTLEPDEEARKRIVEGHIELFSAMLPPEPGARLSRSETPATVQSLDSFFELES